MYNANNFIIKKAKRLRRVDYEYNIMMTNIVKMEIQKGNFKHDK